MKHIQIFKEGTNRPVIGNVIAAEYSDIYEPLIIDTSLKDKLKGLINNDSYKDFIIEVSELLIITKGLEKRIEKLLKHPDFDPFKEKLRESHSEQFGSSPFDFKGKTYYLYTKGNRNIDSILYNYIKRYEYFNKSIALNKPVKYTFR